MPGRLANKTAFVTAAGQGIGHETALAFAAEGARVIATDVDEAKVHRIASDSIHTARLDVLHAADIARGETYAGPIDILCSCAGFVHQGTLLDATEDEWELAFDLNARSMFRTMKAFLPGMLERGRGVIINMASVSSSLPSAVASSKVSLRLLAPAVRSISIPCSPLTMLIATLAVCFSVV